MGWNRWNRFIYALWSPVYDRFAAFGPLTRARGRALQLPDLSGGRRVLLVGVGTGCDLVHLPDEVKVAGVDLSKAMLGRARRKLPPGRDVELLYADAEDLPFPDRSFDTVVLTLILSVVSDARACFAEAVRVVREGGQILVFDKFLPAGRSPSPGRRALNLLTRPFGTDINRRFEDLADGLPCRVVKEEDSLLSGAYRAILLEKIPPSASLPDRG